MITKIVRRLIRAARQDRRVKIKISVNVVGNQSVVGSQQEFGILIRDELLKASELGL